MFVWGSCHTALADVDVRRHVENQDPVVQDACVSDTLCASMV